MSSTNLSLNDRKVIVGLAAMGYRACRGHPQHHTSLDISCYMCFCVVCMSETAHICVSFSIVVSVHDGGELLNAYSDSVIRIGLHVL